MLNHLIRHPTKNNVINIDLCYHQSSMIIFHKQCLVYSSFFVPLIEKKLRESLIPCSRCLLQAIQSFLQFVEMIMKARIHKSFWFLNINFFIKYPFKKELFTSIWNNLNLRIQATPKSNLMDSSLATGANVSSKSRPSICV